MVLLTLVRSQKTLQQLKAAHFGKKLMFEKDHLKELPVAYQKFYQEWKWQQPAPVYQVPQTEKYRLNQLTGQAIKVVDIPIPTKWSPEFDKMLLGGEAIVKGFTQKKISSRRVPHWWVPTIARTVVYSEVLDKYMPVIATKRLLSLIHEHKGFDNYILESPACDLRSVMALKIKRKILMALATGECYPDDEQKRKEVLDKYKKFIMPAEDVEWYGLTLKEAGIKNHLSKQVEPQPLKHLYRKELLEYLRQPKDQETERFDSPAASDSWMKKITSRLPFK